MTDINIGQAQRLTAPCPFALLSVLRDDGSTNLMAVSWWSYLSNHPPTLGACLSKKGLSGELIRKNGEFALSKPLGWRRVSFLIQLIGTACGHWHQALFNCIRVA